jgi:hypothetical protein
MYKFLVFYKRIYIKDIEIMKLILIIILFISLFMFASCATQIPNVLVKPNLKIYQDYVYAIMPFGDNTIQKNIYHDAPETVRRLFEKKLQLKGYNIIRQGIIETALSDFSYKPYEIINEELGVNVGKKLNADIVILGTLESFVKGSFFGDYTKVEFFIKAVDVKSKEVIWEGRHKIDCSYFNAPCTYNSEPFDVACRMVDELFIELTKKLEVIPLKIKGPKINHPPIANAGPDQSVTVNTSVTLNGSASYDPDRDDFTYWWEQTSGPTISLSSNSSSRPTFTPRVGGTYIFTLIVNDGRIDSEPTYVTINVIERNHPPIANAGPDQSVTVNTSVTLNGSANYDPDRDNLTYRWTQIDGPSVNLSDPTSSQTSFITNKTGILKFKLVVSDEESDSSPAYVTVNIVPRFKIKEQPPVADAGPDQSVTVEEQSEQEIQPRENLGTFTHDGFVGSNVERNGTMDVGGCIRYTLNVQRSGELEVCIPPGYELRGDIDADHFEGLKKFPRYPIQFMSYILRNIREDTRINIEINRRENSPSNYIFIFHLYPPGMWPGL